MSDVTLDIQANLTEIHNQRAEPWKITLLDTGETSMTGGRLLRAHHFLKDEEMFCLTYGDGLSNVDINAVINFHKGHGRLATLTATYPPARFGALVLGSDGKVKNFEEKPMGDGSMINGGFFVLNPKGIRLFGR